MAQRKHSKDRLRRLPSALSVALGIAMICAGGESARGALIEVEVFDYLSGEPLPGLGVVANKRSGDQLLWVARKNTDAAGRAVFDLSDLGSGAAYVFVATPYNGGPVQSENATRPGYFAFPVGRLRVTMVAGGTLTPLASTNVILKERHGDGSLAGRVWTATDANGVVVFDPPGLGAGRVYVLEANSPWDGLARLSHDILDTGAMTFVVGNAPLHVTVVDGISGAPMPGLSLIAKERLAGGASQPVASRTTDAQGRATFDLTGLGDGRVYRLAAAPFGGRWIESENLAAAGDYVFRVGTLEVTAINGSNGAPLAYSDVTAKRRSADGSLEWTVRGATDGNGIVRFDLPGLGQGETYVLEAQSPADGLTKQSNDLVTTGRHTFVVGRAPLRVRLLNALSGAPLAGVPINAHLRDNAQELQLVAQRTTDPNGEVVFELAGLGEGATFVLTVAPYNGGIVYSQDLTSAGLYELRVGAVELTVLNGADGRPLAGWSVNALEKQPDGTLVWAKNGVTDAEGLIRFDLPGLGTGRVYRFGAQSPADGTAKQSQDIRSMGQYVFAVGNVPLRVTLENAVSGGGVSGAVITVAERLADGSLSWVGQQRATDGAGRAVFDLDGLGNGRVYVLATRPYNGLWVYSEDLGHGGDHVLRVGALEVRAVNGITGTPLGNHKVVAKEVLAGGTRVWVAAGYTDAVGVIRFSLPEGRRYVVEAASPADGSIKRSAEVVTPSAYTFVVGSAPLRVTLVNGLSGAPLPGTSVTAEEVLRSGAIAFAAQRTTDGAGVALFDLAAFGAGRTYRLYAKPYNGGIVYTEPFSQPVDVYFRTGTVPVTLIDGDNGVPLANRQINAVERMADGSRLWRASGTTDATGTVRFDLPGLSDTISSQPYAVERGARAYAFNAVNPFGNGRDYFSPIAYEEGPMTMRLFRAVVQPFDGTAPALSVASPLAGSNVPAGGFTVSGSVTDDRAIAEVLVAVSDPQRGSATVSASYDSVSSQWSAAVGAEMITAARTVTLSVTAIDRANNRTTRTLPVQVVADATPPSLDIASPADGATVPSAGFLVHGTASDAFGVAALFATLDDPVLGRSIAAPLQLRGDGTWTMAVLRGQVTEGRTALLTLVATDTAGNQRAVSRSFAVTGVDFLAHHVANRITFGASPSLLAEIESSGVGAFIEQQLNPASIDDSTAEALLGPEPPATLSELRRATLLRAIHSRRQLLEVLTLFWDNHFNTDASKHGVVAYEVDENNRFRQLALGRFRDLLAASATSPAMLIYLDNASSMQGKPNENYARELMELHTLGVKGGYTQRDVEEVTRAFTGWTVSGGRFVFDPGRHDHGEKIVLGQLLPGGRGIEDGEAVLDLLARHPSAAKFVCTKLSQLLVSDNPPATLINRCASKFLSTDGAIREVVRLILRSPEFADPAHFRAKVRTPLELITFWARALEAHTDCSGLVGSLSAMGMNLFTNPLPTGWSETGDDWINSHLLLRRIREGKRFARNLIPGTEIDLVAFFGGRGRTGAADVVSFLLRSLFHSEHGTLEHDVALQRLNAGGGFVYGAPGAADRLQDMIATVLGYPGAQYQ